MSDIKLDTRFVAPDIYIALECLDEVRRLLGAPKDEDDIYPAQEPLEEAVAELTSGVHGQWVSGWIDQITDLEKHTTVFAAGGAATASIRDDWFPAFIVIPSSPLWVDPDPDCKLCGGRGWTATFAHPAGDNPTQESCRCTYAPPNSQGGRQP